jgi:signal recognition particle subunit SEC65
MAAQSPSEIAREVQREVLLLRSEFDQPRTELDNAEFRRVRERLAVLENRLSELDKAIEQLKPSKAEAEEMGALKNRLTQLEEQKKLGDTRAFQFIVLFIGGLLTLAINIALLFLKK